jgi:hypothetical protein
MSDPAALLAVSAAGLTGLGIVSAAALKGWDGWLELKRTEIETGAGPSPTPQLSIKELRQRVRKLEAIANGSEGSP